MSYINKQSTTLVRVKLTDIGREQLAKGQLSFNNYMIGDSEVDYGYVKGWSQFVPSIGASTGEFWFPEADGNIVKNIFSQVLRPKDDNPFFSTFLLDQSNQFIFPLNQQSNIQLIKGLVSNQAADRGFFSGSSVELGLSAVTTTEFIKESGTIDLGNFDGSVDLTPYTQGQLTLDTALTATSVNDYIVFKFSNPTLGNNSGDTMTAATINTFYNITEISGTTIKVDRVLPTLSAYSGTIISYYTIPGGNNPEDNYYGLSSLTAYWNTGTLSFDSSCDICVENIPVWNMNNVWVENLVGQYKDSPINYHEHTLFGSEQFMGTKQYLGYNDTLTVSTTGSKLDSISYMDPFQKGICILHYTNSCISNFYGEQFYIDEESNKLLSLDIPVMWHRRNEGTGSGTTLGMKFVSDTVLKTIATNNDIEYYDLIEFSGMSVTPTQPLVVGKVFPQLKIVVIDNEELLASMSYKSNRNYTLPDLTGELVSSVDGNCTGVLKAGESLYMTYWLSNTGTGSTGTTTVTTPTLPNQRYTVLDNTTNSDKDVQFRINNVGQLPYMRKRESVGYDGYGFYADNFKLLTQVINKTNTNRPDPSKWRVVDFTSINITDVTGETINPLLLENQNPNTTGFILTGGLYSGASATTFNLGNELDMSSASNYGKMTFGDERLFYGNLKTYIGATIYKTLFNININGASISSSSNPTYDFGDDRYVSEVGILDSNQNLVLVGKLSRPIRIANSTTASLELTIDF
jgi:hypothetical protein|tara:strand:- start:1361 stop:3592 length:2232 start_codon:yes stop_codon:yes gene_type:complete